MEALAILTALAFLIDALLVIPFYAFFRSATIVMAGAARGALAALCVYLALAESLSSHDKTVLLLLGILALAVSEITYFTLLYLKLRHTVKLN